MFKIHGQFSKEETRWLLDIPKDAQLYLQLQKCKSIHKAAVDRDTENQTLRHARRGMQIGMTLWRAHFSDSAVPIQDGICADTHKCVLFTKHCNRKSGKT